MLKTRVISNLPLVRKRFNKFFRKFPNIVTQGLEQAGIQLKTIIDTRTNRGLDINKERFIAYSPMYSALKGKTVVNLQDTNRMLQSIDSKVKNKNTVQIYFRSQRQAKKALWHQQGMGNLPQRKFFGYDRRTEKVIRDSFEKFIGKQIKALKI